jgi:ABC-2 type transport system ATP-binding protein
MTDSVIIARDLRKRYGKQTLALDGTSFSVGRGRIVGLMGPNGAGKTTALKAILGLTSFEGQLDVLGRDPRRQRDSLMQDVCFIADVAVLPKWLRVDSALDYVAGVHPRFDRTKADAVLARTEIRRRSKVSELSKGMITQLHLALIMAIDAKLLVLDEPTLGLDLLYRRAFYEALLNDYFDHERTILVTTHQVEEVENLLTDVLFINHGRIVLDSSIDDLPNRFVQLIANNDSREAARGLGPLHERDVFGRPVFVFEGRDRADFAGLGEIRTPSVADLFVAKMTGSAA